MATREHHYELDIDSVRALIRAWQRGSEEVGEISTQLSKIHEQLVRAAPRALVEGVLGGLPLAACFAKLRDAAADAQHLAQGLSQDTSTLDANLAAYVEAEAAIEAKLKAVHHAKRVKPVHGGSTHTSGRGSSSSGHGGSSGHRGGSPSGHGGTSRGGNTLIPPGGPRYANQAQVESWINQAFQVLEANGVPANALDQAGVLLIIEHESSGNPNAINNWDSNAQAGDPSRGLMQVIGTTFDEYKLSGHDSIYDPVDNIIAGVRYALSRYGSIQNVPGVRSVENGGQYVGY
jgi:hypothetical protein